MSNLFKRVMSILICAFSCAATMTAACLTPVVAESSVATDQIHADGDSICLRGSGTVEDPLIISTAEELAYLSDPNYLREAEHKNRHYRLINDLDLSGYENWQAIGNEAVFFDGHFDGQGHQIRNLRIHNDAAVAAAYGLFGFSSGSIKNLEIHNSEIHLTHTQAQAYDYIAVAALCAFNFGQIEHVVIDATIHVDGINAADISYSLGGVVAHNQGQVRNVLSRAQLAFKADGSESESPSIVRVGGICGTNEWGGELQLAVNLGEVTHDLGAVYVNGVGGIAGRSLGNISLSANYGKIQAIGRFGSAGGICGSANMGIISDSYNHGSIEAAYAGGIVGSGLDLQITRTYNTGEVNAEKGSGAIAGCAYYLPLTIEHSYFLDGAIDGLGLNLYTKRPFTVNVKPLSEAALRDPSTFSAWDMRWDWYPAPAGLNRSMPVFRAWIEADLDRLPDQLSYAYGEALNLSGAQLRYNLWQIESSVVPLDEAMVSGYDPYSVGEQILSVKAPFVDQHFKVVVLPEPIVTEDLTTITTVETTVTEAEVTETGIQATTIAEVTEIQVTTTSAEVTESVTETSLTEETSQTSVLLETDSSSSDSIDVTTTPIDMTTTHSVYELPATGTSSKAPFYAWPMLLAGVSTLLTVIRKHRKIS